MSDANRVGVSWEKEGSTYGTVDTPTAMNDVRFTGETLEMETNYVSSAEIRSDRQVPDLARVGGSASGDTNHELSYAEYDQLLESMLLSATWTTEDPDIAGAIVVSTGSGDGVYTLDSGVWTDNGVQPAAGQLLRITGAAAAANNGWKVVTSSTTTTVTVQETGTTSGAAEDLLINVMSVVTNGTTFASYHIQKEFEDLTNIFALFRGMVINGGNIDAALESIIALSFSWIGKDELNPAPTATFSARAVVTTNQVMQAVDHIVEIHEGTALTDIDSTNFTVAVANNARALSELGKFGAQDVGMGKADVTGTFQQYFEDSALVNLYTGDTATQFKYVFQDTAGQGYVIYLPQVKFSAGRRNSTAVDSDVIMDMSYTAYLDPIFLYTIRIAKFAA